MKTATVQRLDTALRDEWLHTVEALEDQIAGWVRQEPGWGVEAGETNRIAEAVTGGYTAPTLTIDTPSGQLRVEPIARNYPGSGIVELYAWPTLNRVRLLQGSGPTPWRVLTDSGIFIRQGEQREAFMEWNQGNFIALAKELLAAE